jgi:hypothetical protein
MTPSFSQPSFGRWTLARSLTKSHTPDGCGVARAAIVSFPNRNYFLRSVLAKRSKIKVASDLAGPWRSFSSVAAKAVTFVERNFV